MPREIGILGLKKDPKRQLLFLFKVPQGEEWPSSDSEDDDYKPDTKSDGPDSEDSGDSEYERSSNSSTKSRLTKTGASSNRTNLNSNNNAKAGQQRKQSKRKNSDSEADPPQKKKAKKHATQTKKQNSSRLPTTEGASRAGEGKFRMSEDGDVMAASKTSSTPAVSHLPPELWMRIFRCVVDSNGPLPFLCRASKVCRMWRELASHPTLWRKVDLSYGWIKSTDATLQWLAKHRLSQCREISLQGWKNVTNNAVKELAENCPSLESVNLSHCAKLGSTAVGALVDNCPSLRELDLSFTSSDGVSTQSLKKVAEKLGPSLKSLNVSGNNLKGFHITLNSIMEHCPGLEMLDFSNTIFSTDFLLLNVEKLHVSCPALRILRLANSKVRVSQVSQRVQEESPGFTQLTQLSCAVPTNDSPLAVRRGGVTDGFLQRLLHKAGNLQLLDLRGCILFHPDTLLLSPALNVSQLYLAQSGISRYGDLLEVIIRKWRHSLKVLDLAWTTPQSDHLDDAIAALTELPSSPLEELSLAGTTVTLQSVKLCLEKLEQLISLDLTSCRALPRGIKSLHQGKAALKKLHKAIR